MTSQNYLTLVGIDQDEISKWKVAYDNDPHYKLVLQTMRNDEGKDVLFHSITIPTMDYYILKIAWAIQGYVCPRVFRMR